MSVGSCSSSTCNASGARPARGRSEILINRRVIPYTVVRRISGENVTEVRRKAHKITERSPGLSVVSRRIRREGWVRLLDALAASCIVELRGWRNLVARSAPQRHIWRTRSRRHLRLRGRWRSHAVDPLQQTVHPPIPVRRRLRAKAPDDSRPRCDVA
eukprot:7382947-Prymnesium_polylepis.2